METNDLTFVILLALSGLSSFVWLNPKYPSKFNCIYRLKTFDSGVMVLQLQSHDEEQIIKDTTKTVMKCIFQY